MRDCEPVRVQCHLARMPLFAGLALTSLSELPHKIVPITVLKGHALFMLETIARACISLCSGQFKLVLLPS